jgi:DNA-binding response OmpR family regulator
MALKLLIADDSPDDAILVAYALKCAGFEVEWRRVEEETDFARELPGAELVICDFSMPKFSPVRALEVIQIMMLGAVGYLLKDRLERLGQAVHDALGGCSNNPP